MSEHIITREMLIATLADVMGERDRALERELRAGENFSNTLSANARLREENERLGNVSQTLQRAKDTLNAEILRLHNELDSARQEVTKWHGDSVNANAKLAKLSEDTYDIRTHAQVAVARSDYENLEAHLKDTEIFSEQQAKAIRELNDTVVDLTTSRDLYKSSNAQNYKELQAQRDELTRTQAALEAEQMKRDVCIKDRDRLSHELDLVKMQRDRVLESDSVEVATLHGTIRELRAKQCQCVPVLEEKIAKLKAQLPADMQDSTIRFVECPEGHSRLIADNWVGTTMCMYCRAKELEAKAEAYLLMWARLKDLFREGMHSNEMLQSNPPKNMVAYRGDQILRGVPTT